MNLPSKTFTSPLRALALEVAACAASAAGAATSVTLSLVPSQTITPPGAAVDVLVHMDLAQPESGSPLTVFGAQVALRFDATRLELVGASPVTVDADGDGASDGPFALLSSETGLDSVTFGVFDPTFGGIADSGAVATIRLKVRDTLAAECSIESLLYFDTVDVHQTEIAIAGGGTITPKMVNLPALNLDDVAPELTVDPTTVVIPTDAGSIVGAAVDEPDVGATDLCDTDVTVTRLVTLPDDSSSDAWPAEFPIGTSSVVWSATDDAGNRAEVKQTIEVLNHQIMDAFVTMAGTTRAVGSYDRTIRFKIGSATIERTLTISPDENNTGLAMDLEVPVAAGYACVAAKDPMHSLTDTDDAVSITGRRYTARFVLLQGDSSIDDLVDIIDFGMFLLDEGHPASPEGRSNFNADGIVDHADFSYIAINYFKVGESCGSFDGGAPRSEITVKELRRLGLGHLAAADLNGDGRIDARDIQQYIEHGGAARPTAEKGTPRARW